MAAIRSIRQRFWLSVISLSLMSLVILFVPATFPEDSHPTIWSTAIAALFWLLALCGYWAVFSANKKRKAFVCETYGKDIQQCYLPGALCFFSNPIATIADIAAIVALLLLVIAMITPLQDTYFVVVLLSLFIWAANMHCLFNSRIYRITIKKPMRGSKS